MITSRYATLHDIDLILDEAEKGNAETRWNFTFDRDAGHDHVRTLIENETSEILTVERDGVPAGGAMAGAKTVTQDFGIFLPESCVG